MATSPGPLGSTARKARSARDRMGVRPLHYAIGDGVLLFASEAKALFQVPGTRPVIDPLALSQCFTFWFPLAPRTAFQGVHELPPGHLMVVERDNLSTRCYWRPRYPSRHDREPVPRTEEDLAEELRALLLDAIRLRLRADVPVGAFLSGGLDSSAVTALAQKAAPGRLRTFSVGFEAAEFDESRYQREMARALRLRSHVGHGAGKRHRRDFPGRGSPHGAADPPDGAPPLYHLSSLVKASGIKTVLTGEGADEILGGYDLFKEAKVRQFWARQPHSSWRPLLLSPTLSLSAGIAGPVPRIPRGVFQSGPRPARRSLLLSSTALDHDGRTAPLPFRRLDPAVERLQSDRRAQGRTTAGILLVESLVARIVPRRRRICCRATSFPHKVIGWRWPTRSRGGFHSSITALSSLPPSCRNRMKLRGLTEKHLLRRSLHGGLASHDRATAEAALPRPGEPQL